MSIWKSTDNEYKWCQTVWKYRMKMINKMSWQLSIIASTHWLHAIGQCDSPMKWDDDELFFSFSSVLSNNQNITRVTVLSCNRVIAYLILWNQLTKVHLSRKIHCSGWGFPAISVCFLAEKENKSCEKFWFHVLFLKNIWVIVIPLHVANRNWLGKMKKKSFLSYSYLETY